ncbi:MAG TPA: energy transducer TonB [Gemmatimonadales bacterium]|nr:energy transducer TonB [Gemmatimonadales bacterium]
MFENLIETKPKKAKTGKQLLLSVFVHIVAIGGAVYGTLEAKEAIEKPKAEKVEFVEMKKEEPPPPEDKPPPPPEVVAAPPPPKGFQVLTAPIKIPDVLPEIDLTKKVTDEADFTGKGVAGGIAKGVVGGTAPVADQTYFEFQVEKQVAQIPGSVNLRYPDMLRSANVEGEVLAQFVVDTTGRVEKGSIKILKTSHDLFTSAVMSALNSARYYPAEIGGRKVKQLVQQPFNFTLTR